MKTTYLMAAALVFLPLGVTAGSAANDVSVVVTDETKVIDLKVDKMR